MKSYTITVNGNVYDVTVEENGEAVKAPAAPKAAPKAPAAPKAAPKNAQGAGNIRVEAGAAGKVFKIEASVGQKVKRGDAVVIIEAMKMETTVISKVNGTVDKIYVKDGEEVNEDTLLVSFIIDMEEQPEEVHPELPEMDFTTLEKDEFKTVDVTEEENK